MNIGAYRGASALAAYEKWQEVISQNIAYGSIPGFKKSDIAFEVSSPDNARLGGQAGGAGSVMPQMTTKVNFAPGTLQHTGNDLDFAIQGKGFFQIKRKDGTLGYTRNGEFQMNADRTLVTRQGDVVMGEGAPITFNANGGAISINAGGTISQVNSQTHLQEQVGKLTVYDFKDPQKLERSGDGLFAPVNGSAQPQPVEQPGIIGGVLENSNVSSLTEMVNLINVSRAYEANQKAIQGSDDNDSKAIQTLGDPPA